MRIYDQESCSPIDSFSVSNKDIQSLNFLSPIITIELKKKKKKCEHMVLVNECPSAFIKVDFLIAINFLFISTQVTSTTS